MPVDEIFENPEIVLANATEFLIQGQEFYEAGILLLCDIQIAIWDDSHPSYTDLLITLTGDRAIYNIINVENHESTIAIRKAFNAVLPMQYVAKHLSCLVRMKKAFDENWRTEMLEMIEGKRPLNQGNPIKDAPRFEWEHLYFRSPAEVAIAKELDNYKTFFLPNCMGRLNLETSRANREVDFLVCFAGKWGILEVNGDTYHTSAAKDHERAALFRKYGIRVFSFYEATRCLKDPNGVVVEFLRDLKQNG